MTRLAPALSPGLLAAAVLLLALAFPSAVPPAGAQTVASRNPGDVESGTYQVDPLHTQILWGVSHIGFTTFYGRFNDITGTLHLDPANPAASALQVTLPADSISTPVPELDQRLKSPAWLDVAKFPTIRFVTTAITRTGRDSASITGNLTLHGITRPVTLAATFNGAGINPVDHKYTVGFQLTGMMRRSAFGISAYEPLIGDELQLTIAAAFEKS